MIPILLALAGATALVKNLVHTFYGAGSVLPPETQATVREADRFLIYIAYLFLSYLAVRNASNVGAAQAVAAALLIILGAGLSLTAILTLGQSHCENINPPPHATLKTSGIYAVTRHPMRIGFFLEVGGITLMIGAGWTALSLAVLAALLVHRTLREERVLFAHYGDAYRLYVARVPAIPFLVLGRHGGQNDHPKLPRASAGAAKAAADPSTCGSEELRAALEDSHNSPTLASLDT